MIATGPHPISEWFLPWKIAQLLNLRLLPPEQATGARLGLWFEMTLEPPVRRTDPGFFGEVRALNAGCPDISKRRVMSVFEEVFGYGYEVDPHAHVGPIVCKTNGNAKHDGRLIQGPLEADSLPPGDHVFQRLIDARPRDSELVEDLRVCVIGGEIAYVLAKRRSPSDRFGQVQQAVEPRPEAFSGRERRDLLEFADRFGLEVGELDVLRDRDDGRIYVVDANNTPFAPPLITSTVTEIRCMHAAAAAFERQFLEQDEEAAR